MPHSGDLFGLNRRIAGRCWYTVAICILAASCSRPEPVRSQEPRPVKTMIVTAGNDPVVRIFPGRVDASRKVDLAFQVPGLLMKLRVKEGQRVTKGQVVAQLRREEFESRLQAAGGQLDQARAALAGLQAGERPEERLRREAQVRAAQAKLANAKTEFDRYGRLVQSRAVSRSEYELAETAYHVAQEDYKAAVQIAEKASVARQEDIDAQAAQVRGHEGRVAEAKLQLADATLRAPFSGVIAERYVDEGQTIAPNNPVVRLQNSSEIDIVADVPEPVMAAGLRSAAGQAVAEFNRTPGMPQPVRIPVRIKEVAQTADPATQTFQVRFAGSPPRKITILPGMTAIVSVTGRPAGARPRILVPISAIVRQDSGEQVAYVIGADGTVSCRAVQAGAVKGGDIEVVRGLRPGDRIAVAGVSFLHEGMKVRDLGNALGSPR